MERDLTKAFPHDEEVPSELITEAGYPWSGLWDEVIVRLERPKTGRRMWGRQGYIWIRYVWSEETGWTRGNLPPGFLRELHQESFGNLRKAFKKKFTKAFEKDERRTKDLLSWGDVHMLLTLESPVPGSLVCSLTPTTLFQGTGKGWPQMGEVHFK